MLPYLFMLPFCTNVKRSSLLAVYNRTDILEWLVNTRRMSLNTLDGTGRTPLEVADASNAVDTRLWITKYNAKLKIQSFVNQNYRRMLAHREQQRLINASMDIQKIIRGRLVRKTYRGPLLMRLDESQAFNAIWKDAIKEVPTKCEALSGWALVCEQIDANRRLQKLDDEGNLVDEMLTQAATDSLMNRGDDDDELEDDVAGLSIDNSCIEIEEEEVPTADSLTKIDWSQFQMSSHVVKFLRQGDPKYREVSTSSCVLSM